MSDLLFWFAAFIAFLAKGGKGTDCGQGIK